LLRLNYDSDTEEPLEGGDYPVEGIDVSSSGRWKAGREFSENNRAILEILISG